MNEFAKAGLIFLILLAFVIVYSYNPVEHITGVYKLDGMKLGRKPDLSGSIVSNPDFFYEESGWMTEPEPTEYATQNILEVDDWASNGYYYNNETVRGREGVIFIHPFTEEIPRYISRFVYIPEGTHRLLIGASNVVTEEPHKESDVYDVILVVEIKDTGTGNIYRDTNILYSNEGWQDFQYYLSNFSDSNVIITVKGKAGGEHGEWSNEWATVDYIAVI